jgi:hypothetical protein
MVPLSLVELFSKEKEKSPTGHRPLTAEGRCSALDGDSRDLPTEL